MGLGFVLVIVLLHVILAFVKSCFEREKNTLSWPSTPLVVFCLFIEIMPLGFLSVSAQQKKSKCP
jgi:hypothetical protein